MHRRSLLTAALLMPLALSPLPAFAKKRVRVFAPAGIALGGSDPVAYFSDGAPLAGRSDLALKWGGAVWCFSSEANRTAFEMDPFRYLPQYGGHCAYSMAKGEKRGSIREAWAIEGGRLYLAASRELLAEFLADKAANIALADQAWINSAR